MIDLETLNICKECGVCYNMYACKIKEEKKDYYGTDILLKCPVCKNIEEINLGDGMYK